MPCNDNEKKIKLFINFDANFILEMIKLVLRYSSNKPVKAKPQPTGLPAFRAKLNEKKSVKRMVLEKRKSDVLLDKGGTMFKVQAQFSGIFFSSENTSRSVFRRYTKF